MAYQTITFQEFTELIRADYNPAYPEDTAEFRPFAWLLGAGMSVSSGIPLAAGVCQRIALFEYLRRKDLPKPWDLDGRPGLLQNQRDFRAFFTWWNKQDSNYLKHEIEIAQSFLHENHPELLQYETNDPYYYQELFSQVFKNSEKRTNFMSALINAGKGINLANLGLAGILRDYPKWGHTVFTTNFDDLLLRALLSLGSNARLFSDASKIDDVLELHPKFPQIVYLHGKHTNPNLKNSPEEIEKVKAQESIAKGHIVDLLSKSNLIVLGYSGWQDLARAALTELRDKPSVNGSIYWVPFRHISELSKDVQAFLDSFPSERMYIIQNTKKEELLDADAFILSLCQFLDPSMEGIATYRNELLNQAAKQHKFVFDQLEQDYPTFAPNRAKFFIDEARKAYLKGDRKDALKWREKAERLLLSDLPEVLQGELNYTIGMFDLQLRDYKSAKEYLSQALENWRRVSSVEESLTDLEERRTPFEFMLDIQQALAECYLYLEDFLAAKEQLGQCWHIIKKGLVNDPVKAARSNLLFGLIALYEGHEKLVLRNLERFKEETAGLSKTEHPRLFGHFHFLSGAYHQHYSSRISYARKHFKEAAELYEQAGRPGEKANCNKYLADIEIRNSKFEESRAMLRDVLDVYEALDDRLGQANISSSFADLHFQKAILGEQSFLRTATVEAITHYQQAADAYETCGSNYNYINALTDQLILHQEIISKTDWGPEEMPESEYQEIKTKLIDVMKVHKNAYASSKLNFVAGAENQNESLIGMVQEEE